MNIERPENLSIVILARFALAAHGSTDPGQVSSPVAAYAGGIQMGLCLALHYPELAERIIAGLPEEYRDAGKDDARALAEYALAIRQRWEEQGET